jgi:uncharacterized protein
MKKRKAKFQLKKLENNEYHFVLKAANNEVIAQSETYETKQGAEKGIEAIIKAVEEIIEHRKNNK